MTDKQFSIKKIGIPFNFRLGTYNFPSGSSAISLTTEREFDGTDGWDGNQKCPFNVLRNLCEFRICNIYLTIYTKIVNVLIGFKI